MKTLPAEIRVLVAQLNALKETYAFYYQWHRWLDGTATLPRMNARKLRTTHKTGYDEYLCVSGQLERIQRKKEKTECELNILLGLK